MPTCRVFTSHPPCSKSWSAPDPKTKRRRASKLPHGRSAACETSAVEYISWQSDGNFKFPRFLVLPECRRPSYPTSMPKACSVISLQRIEGAYDCDAEHAPADHIVATI